MRTASTLRSDASNGGTSVIDSDDKVVEYEFSFKVWSRYVAKYGQAAHSYPWMADYVGLVEPYADSWLVAQVSLKPSLVAVAVESSSSSSLMSSRAPSSSPRTRVCVPSLNRHACPVGWRDAHSRVEPSLASHVAVVGRTCALSIWPVGSMTPRSGRSLVRAAEWRVAHVAVQAYERPPRHSRVSESLARSLARRRRSARA